MAREGEIRKTLENNAKNLQQFFECDEACRSSKDHLSCFAKCIIDKSKRR